MLFGRRSSEPVSLTALVSQVDPFGNSQRVATVLMYLQGADEGGETVFPHPSAEWATEEQKEAARAADLSEARGRVQHIVAE